MHVPLRRLLMRPSQPPVRGALCPLMHAPPPSASTGRGLDTHRTWEALSLGTIPIVLRNSLDPLYTHLPVMVIGGLEDLTPKKVHEFYASVRRRVEEGTIGWERATAFYWVQVRAENLLNFRSV